jgi:hypothetical protein
MGRTAVQKDHELFHRRLRTVPIISVNSICVKELIRTYGKEKILSRITEY